MYCVHLKPLLSRWVEALSSSSDALRLLLIKAKPPILKLQDHRRLGLFAAGVRRVLISLVLVSIASTRVNAQDQQMGLMPERTDTLIVVGAGPFLLRPFLVASSEMVWLDGIRLPRTSYQMDARTGFIHLYNRSGTAPGVLVVRYRYIPVSVTGTFRRWPFRETTPGRERVSRGPSDARPFQLAPAGQSLQRSGSITRGITTGSARNVAIESGLRLQVEGQIAEGLGLRAVLTDENTPILPEGSTQRLNEFDRVFIELSTSFGSVQLGDVDGRIDNGLFGQFRRKLQGVSAQGQFSSSSGSLLHGGAFSVIGATSRGLFRIQEIRVVDGVQGPYRLEGKNGERFIILLPGSEVVYLDGMRLQRGESEDYVVDYATGEVTFTPRRIMAADRRITIEFQYTTQQFTRTLVAASGQTEMGTLSDGAPILTIGASAIREADGDQFSEEFGLSSSDSLEISLSGDEDAFRSGAIPVSYDSEALYTQYVVDKISDPDGKEIGIFRVVNASPPDSVQVYRVTFSRVGAGKGHYRRAALVTNGIAFEYVGSGRGDYEPVRPLPKPTLHQLVNFRAVLRPFRYIRLSGEWAASILDLNRLSGVDASDDEGTAHQIQVAVDHMPVAGDLFAGAMLSGSYHRSFTDVNFASFERIRPVEYTRRWNIQHALQDPTRGMKELGDEVVNEVTAALDWSDSTRVSASVARLSLGDFFSGNRWDGRLRLRVSSLPELDYRVERILSTDHLSAESGDWIRQLGRVSRSMLQGSLIPYVEMEHEDLKQSALARDSLIAPSARFLEARAGASWIRDRFTWGLDLENRSEQRVVAGSRKPLDAWTLSSTLSVSPSRSVHSEFQVGYRRTKEEPTEAVQSDAVRTNESLIVRVNGRWTPDRRGSNVSWMYQAQTERSASLQEIYIRTGQERGEYVWVDENNDGVVQLEEFLPETTPEEGLYVRTFLPSDSLEAVASVRGRLRVDLKTGSASNASPSAIMGFLKGLNSVTLIDVEEKSRDPRRSNLYLMRLSRFQSSDYTLNGRIRLRQELSLFRNLRRFDLTLTAQIIRTLTDLAAGEESRKSKLAQVRARWGLTDFLTFRISAERTVDALNSQSFSSRNYDIFTSLVVPSLTWAVSRPFQLSISTTVSRKRERRTGGEATIIRVPLDGRYRIERRLDLSGRFETSSITLSEAFSGRTAFEMTDGRGPGTSYIWSLGVRSSLSDVLTATLAYDGRAPQDRPVIHTARFQLSARF